MSSSLAAKTPGKEMWKGFLIAVTISFILLQMLFLGNMSYLSATQFRSANRFHNFNMLFVDYDGGVVGQSVQDAYSILQGDTFPSLHVSPATDYPKPSDVRKAVCSGDYWAAIYSNPSASSDLTAALTTGEGSRDALTYVWNGARYPAMSQGAIYSSILTLIQVTRSAYHSRNASAVLASGELASNPGALRAFLDPIQATEINIQVAEHGARVLHNTVSMVMPIIQQFFFMMALNGISEQFRIFTRIGVMSNGLVRMFASLIYTWISALGMTGYIWAFRESWAVNGNQFVLTWIITWLYMHINFIFMDILTTYVPMQFMPFCILTWVIINVASTISPFEMSPGFFRWGYALPAHEIYQVMVQIWSGGCNNQLHRALPILFSWWIVGLVVAAIAVRHRCHRALIAEKAVTEKDKVEKDDRTVISLAEDNHPQPPLSGHSSTRRILSRSPEDPIELSTLEYQAYGPSSPTRSVSGDRT